MTKPISMVLGARENPRTPRSDGQEYIQLGHENNRGETHNSCASQGRTLEERFALHSEQNEDLAKMNSYKPQPKANSIGPSKYL